jgi:anti-anti-sigma factor
MDLDKALKEYNNTNKEITISYELFKDLITVKLRGYIDTYNSIKFTNIINEFFNSLKFKIMIIDLEYITMMSSTGIGSMLEISKKCATGNIKLYLLKMNRKVLDIFELLGFKSFFSIIDDVSQIRK